VARHALDVFYWHVVIPPDVRSAVIKYTGTVACGQVVTHQLLVQAVQVPVHATAVQSLTFRSETTLGDSPALVRNTSTQRSFVQHVRMDERAITTRAPLTAPSDCGYNCT